MEKKTECIQKGKNNRVGAWTNAEGWGWAGPSASPWLGVMAHTFCLGLPLSQYWSGTWSWSL